MKKYLEFIKESTYLNAISSETLEAKLEDLQLQMTELQEEMASIRSILEYRKTNNVTEFAKTLPESIFDFNQEQLDFIFEHHEGVNQKQYDLAREFYQELLGVHDFGYNRVTNQTTFAIRTSHSFDNDDEDLAEGYTENEQQVNTIKFLGENLKKVDTNSRERGEYFGVGNAVKFYVSYYFVENLEFVLYVSETELYIANSYGYGRKTRYNSISKMLEALVDEDLSHKDTGWER